MLPSPSEALEKHALWYRMRGLPLPLDDDDDLWGIIDEPLWSWDEVSESDQSALRALAKGPYAEEAQDREFFDSPAKIMWAVLVDYAISCPHFPEWKKVDDSLMFEECISCGVRMPVTSGTVGEFFGGEFNGTRRLLPIPPPPMWDFANWALSVTWPPEWQL